MKSFHLPNLAEILLNSERISSHFENFEKIQRKACSQSKIMGSSEISKSACSCADVEHEAYIHLMSLIKSERIR